jgi:hypothetical protein
VAQAFVFGAMAAFLGVAANTLFLEAFGAGWLPATYIAIGFAGIVVSGAVAGTAQRYDLVGIALAVLGGAAAGLGIAWLVARDGGAAWVSIPLLVLFPILIQLGFVFLGAQAGRLLDIAGLKAGFPRIMAGFPVGAAAGGQAAAQIVAALGRIEAVLLAAALAQAAFAALVWATGRRHPIGRQAPAPAAAGGIGHAGDPDRPSLRRLLASRFVALILAYQVLSALASQVSDYLVYERAAALLPDPGELARFLAGFTTAMNVASIAFLVLFAGPLLRRFGLRLGITANPIVLAGLALAMVAVLGVAGGASTAMLLTVTAARIADVALTDGMTRTSVNVTFQAIPERSRLAVQAAVEGVGVPVAIAASGVLILVLNALPDALGVTIAALLVTCVAWVAGAVLLVGEYGPALVHALRRRPRLVAAGWATTADDEAAVRALFRSADPRDARAAIELASLGGATALAADIAAVADDPRPDVRMGALAALAGAGDEAARSRLAALVMTAVDDPDRQQRLVAAQSLGALGAEGRIPCARLLEDPDVAVRVAALDAVAPGAVEALEPALRALGDARTAGAAAEALDRLGDLPVPALDARLTTGLPDDPAVLRLVRALRTPSAARDAVLLRHLAHPDRDLGLALIERLARAEPASAATAAALDRVLEADAAHAARILAALEALAPGAVAGTHEASAGPVRRALGEELDLVAARAATLCLARGGLHDVGPAVLEVRGGGSGAAVAAEALAVLLPPSIAHPVVAILDSRLTPDERLRRLGRPGTVPADAAGWLEELVDDPLDEWRSPWLRECARHATGAGG